MKKVIFFTLVLLPTAYLEAQNRPEHLSRLEAEPYRFIAEIASERSERDAARIAVEYAFIGAYQQALSAYELDRSVRIDAGEEPDRMSSLDSAYFFRFRPTDALTYLFQRAKEERIIIINEAHSKPLHRVFVESLLDSLYARGFRYLGLEALTPNADHSEDDMLDARLPERGYPLNSRYTGHYTREPQFGNLIRKALESGFEVFGYEKKWTVQQDLERDLAQAHNVNKILDQDPEAKILLLCGHAHLVERAGEPKENYGKARWMAGYLKELTGIDPLSVNQEALTERAGAPNSPYYSLIEAKEPAVLIDHEGRPFNGPEGFDKFDVLVYHPPTRYRYGRPEWLYRRGKYKAYPIESGVIKLECPCQIRAYREGDDELSVPIDILEIAHPNEDKALVLPPGAYRFMIENKEGMRQDWFTRF
jgi:hypothetical protein